jgi:hypothetical protein
MELAVFSVMDDRETPGLFGSTSRIENSREFANHSVLSISLVKSQPTSFLGIDC